MDTISGSTNNTTIATAVTTEKSSGLLELDNVNPDHIALRLVYGIVGTFGIFGNILVCLVIYKIRFLNTIPNLLIFHQSIIDAIGSVFVIIYHVFPAVPLPTGSFRNFVCSFWLSRYLMWATFTVSTTNLFLITFERYYAVVWPLKHHRNFTVKKLRIFMVVEWIACFIFRSYLMWATSVREGCFLRYPSEKFQAWFGGIVFLIEFLLPLFVMLGTYISMLKVLSKSVIHPQLSVEGNIVVNTQDTDPSFLKTKRNIIKTLLIVLCVYAICWAPNEFLFLYYNLGGYLNFTGVFYHFTVVLVVCNTWVNVVVYSLKYKKFQKGLRQWIKMLKCFRKEDVFQENASHSNAENGLTVVKF